MKDTIRSSRNHAFDAALVDIIWQPVLFSPDDSEWALGQPSGSWGSGSLLEISLGSWLGFFDSFPDSIVGIDILAWTEVESTLDST